MTGVQTCALPILEEIVPEKYHEHLSVFLKKESERMPLRKPWDHGIELKEGFVPRKSKVYVSLITIGTDRSG